MKKKHIRTMIVSALILVLAVTAVLRIDIEPAEQTAPAPAPSSPVINTQEALAQSDISATTQPEKAPEVTTPPVQVPESDLPAVPQPAEPPSIPEQTEPSQPVQEQIPPAAAQTPETTTPVETPNIPEVVPAPAPAPTEPERHVCTIEIRCDTVTDTSKLENQAAAPFVPASGVILAAAEVEFTPGESVFDILLRATRERNIHLEFRDDNLYSGKYIEGINYLYEMDGGALSGWMYKVNGQFPNYGCAACTVNDGDAIVWMYTCDLGLDVGDNSTW